MCGWVCVCVYIYMYICVCVSCRAGTDGGYSGPVSEAAGDGRVGGHRQTGGGMRLAHGRALLLQHQLASKELEGDGRRRTATGQRRGDGRGCRWGWQGIRGQQPKAKGWRVGAGAGTPKTQPRKEKRQRQPRAVVTEREQADGQRAWWRGESEPNRHSRCAAVLQLRLHAARCTLHERPAGVETSAAVQSARPTTVSSLRQPCASDSHSALPERQTQGTTLPAVHGRLN